MKLYKEFKTVYLCWFVARSASGVAASQQAHRDKRSFV